MKSMSEMVTVHDIESLGLSLSMDREQFYTEQEKVFVETGKPSKMVEVVHVLLFHQDGSLLIQQRSNKKTQNQNLLDKSAGGHIQYGNTPDYTVMVETVQELQVPSITLKNETDFRKTYLLLQKYLNTVAVVQYVGSFDTTLGRLFGDKRVLIANRIHFFLGVYTGAVKNVDREAKGIIFYAFDDLRKEVAETPERFTEDIQFLLREHADDIRSFSLKLNK